MQSRSLSRLRWHAGLGELPEAQFSSIAACTWPVERLGSGFAEATEDVVEVLAMVNHELNGTIPSEAGHLDEGIPRGLAYAVMEILNLLRRSREASQSDSQREAVANAEWTIATAWTAVLAGDIDDIKEHVALERAARSG